MSEKTQQPRQIPTFVKWILRAQSWMLSKGLLGSMSNYVMTITVKGRKSGKEYSTPVGYLSDGDHIIALNPHGRSNWYKNVLVNPEVKVNIKGDQMTMRGRRVTSEDEKKHIFDLYLANYRGDFTRIFDIERDASDAEQANAINTREFIVFEPIQ